MGIGTSKGAYYDDAFHHATAMWDDKYDENVITPNEVDTNKQLNQVENDELGGIEVNNHMPFPDNNNPDTDFVNRFPKNLKEGILNDLKRPAEKPLARKINLSEE